MIKIIFSDMDGTLLTSDNKLPEGFDEMMTELKRRGVIFSPASGRQYASLLRSFPKYKDEFLFLTDNGTLIIQNGKEIFSQPMNRGEVINILNQVSKIKNIFPVFCGKKCAYILSEQSVPEFTDELEKYFTKNRPVDRWEDVDDTPIKISICDPTGHADVNTYPKLAPFYEDYQVVLASDIWTDITAPGSNKGIGIESVQKIFNLKPEECAAFGDYLNDCEMMQAVGYSFAMANAHPDLKKIAKYETLSNDEFGVIVGIKKLIADGLV